jgi:hypothetical protein
MKRILKVQKLSQDCMKHLQPDKEALANQILYALLERSSVKNEPVKLSEIAKAIYGSADKDKQDILRLTMEKTLLKCGIVDKIYFAERDVRYFPVAYRFQEVQRVETGTGAKIEQLMGDIVQLPRKNWPIPAEYFDLISSKAGCEQALKKVEEDFGQGLVTSSVHEKTRARLQKELEGISKKLKEYEALSEIM